jgi:hypothetical protein
MAIIKNTSAARSVINKNFKVRPYNTEIDPVVEEWDLEPEIEDVEYTTQTMTELKPTDFVEFGIVIPDQQTKQLKQFSFAERRYLKPVYDTTSPRVLLKCGRQVEKSTYLGNRLLALTCIQPSFTSLYVSPTNEQTKTFSNDRIREPLDTSVRLQAWTNSSLSQNVFRKKFINRSQIVMRYAFLNADRVRGIPADLVCIDEIQDILTDNIPVIEECISHSSFKFKLYAGTPKSLDNTIEGLWVDESTQNEWVVPCDSCGGGDYRHWNILSEENIGRYSLICNKCKKQIYPMHDHAQWASLNPNPRVPYPMDGYRVPQIMVPWMPWDDILNKQMTYSRAKFHNEVLGESYDSGTRPLTRADVESNCSESITLNRSALQTQMSKCVGRVVYMGIDWGTGENTFTVVTIGVYYDSFFSIVYARRFEGPESEPDRQIQIIDELIAAWRVQYVGCDYGGGFDRNDKLIRKYGIQKIFKYQYSTITGAKVKWESGLSRYLVNRTEVMSDMFNAIKRKNVFRFPKWADWEKPFGQDMLNIFSEYSEERKMNEYKKSRSVTDDTFHSILLCFLVSQLNNPRPDVLVPMKAQSPTS